MLIMNNFIAKHVLWSQKGLEDARMLKFGTKIFPEWTFATKGS